MASCRDCPCDSTPCRDFRQEAESHGESLQEAIYQAQQSLQEARDHEQSRRKPNMTDSLCRKRKFADSFIPCVPRTSYLSLYCFLRSGPEVVKLFSCSTQLSIIFFLLINVKMPTIVGILTFMSGKKKHPRHLSLNPPRLS